MSTSPTPQPQQDWFAANAPPPVSSSGDWFAQNAPKPPASSRFGSSFLSGLGVTSDEEAKNFFEHPINTLMGMAKGQGELATKAKDAYDRGDYKAAIMHGLNYLVPLIGQQTDKAGEQLSEGDIAGGVGRTLGVAAPMVAGSPEVRTAASDAVSNAASAVKPQLAKVGSAATAVGESLDPDVVGLASPRLAHALRLSTKVGKVASKLGAETVEAAPAAAVETPAAKLPAAFDPAPKPYKPPISTVDNPGKIPQVEPPSPSAAPVTAGPKAAAPEVAAAPATVSPAALEKQLNDSLGGKPLQPNVTLRQQLQAKAAASSLPEGFTPVKSTALKGYKYDPAAQEFTTVTNNGQLYTHGEVTPEEAKAFTDADSKGQAWNTLRQNHVLVKQNGLPVKPIARSAIPEAVSPKTLADLSSTPAPKPKAAAAAASGGTDDLTSLLQQSLDNTKASKGGVSTSIDPATITKRWGVDEKSLADTREQTRGMNAKQYEEYIQKLTQRYKDGETPEPLLETRDEDNNIIEGDGRARAIAARRAGVKRIPIIVRRKLGELR